MKNNIFDKTIFTTSLNSIKETEQQIEDLKQNIKKYYQELDSIIRKSLIDYQWKPYYNEKAVYIMLEEKTAWHVWFLEEDTGYFRFREAPNEYTDIRNFCRQKIEPSETRETHEWVLPMWLFEELNSRMEIYIQEDKYKSWRQKDRYWTNPKFH